MTNTTWLMCEKRSACSSQVAHIWSHIPCSDFRAIVYFFTASLYLSYFKQISCQKLCCTVYCSNCTVYVQCTLRRSVLKKERNYSTHTMYVPNCLRIPIPKFHILCCACLKASENVDGIPFIK